MNILAVVMLFAQIKGIDASGEIKVNIRTSRDETYQLLTKTRPLVINVDGPTWLRVYTRIPVRADEKGVKRYKLILQENDLKERFITLETERSRVARMADVRLSKWRSFYIRVPRGPNTYRVVIWTAPSDSVLARVAYEAPVKWQDIPPAAYNAKLQATEEEKVIDYFEATTARPVVVSITGPAKLKVITRLGYSPAMNDDQVYNVTVKDNDRIVKNSNFRAYRSETTAYHNRLDVVPSNPHSFYLTLKKGSHRLEFSIAGSQAEAAGFRFLVPRK